ncbi:bifunctional [glutamine synthetase] adenylyltransferase/[glutamine synthetase]-adenylyl-L-tyrosine phosphorylase [Rarobacter faecitabidus]|uniref:Bifunctional glutamine synthetase adenylyltransferase/adenylyl-removing enzyme n=1 Tax=Rarobacter faecitabidus TaxID=13243 RepID=A0A542ZVJ2_RARFA|nr:bifunctional [glutamine synthetase] adenylyltransferase/[glutamine synthetase]-adenylyl-L-tyrosine phosphorylase [Rarobacter faecitabidus]TQL64266.1 glutamate-ammonia-ligase adenylyltransferase [Rarobacter faecitabidus]
MARELSLSRKLRRAGFDDTARAEGLWHDATLQRLFGSPETAELWLEALNSAASPDDGLLTLIRLAEALESDAGARAVWDTVSQDESARARVCVIAGGSGPLADDLVRRPQQMLVALASHELAIGADAREVRAELLGAVGADPEADVPVATAGDSSTIDAMRRAYRLRLTRIAAADLTSEQPLSLMPAVAAALADLAAAALEASLAIARATLPGGGAEARLAIIGMGKTGGRELNYVSDVDVIYVVEPADGADEESAIQVGTKLASAVAHACAGSSGESPLWPVDAALRPEGKQGPLVRTLSSHVAYYERWAKTWEFQALLKARPVAGDAELGQAYRDALQPMVWRAVTRENFVEDARAMRRRVEDHVPPQEADRQIKLGKGGLRDVEFTLQLLQLVHGRADGAIRSGNTLTALAALSAGGYVGRADASQLSVCYRFLRVLEHRIQLARLRRTHLMPTSESDLRKLARAAGLRQEGAEGLQQRWLATRREVRSLHEELFYRPLLPAVAQLSADEAALSPEAARERLGAIGYRDPKGAMRHIEALTEGISRRASIQRQLLPVMLGWFAEGADPDRGLLAFRRLSDELGSAHWYLKLLRDSPSAAVRLAKVLSNSQYMADQLSRSPETVHWLADDDALQPLAWQRLDGEIDAVLHRADAEDKAIDSLRAIRRRELARTAAGELLGVVDPPTAQGAIARVTDMALQGALRIALRTAELEGVWAGRPAPATFAIIAMGRLGGLEMGYGSDADVMFVYEPTGGASDADANEFAKHIAQRIRALLVAPGREPSLQVDADLRPEGRNGPLVRSFASYTEYYDRWAETWERQALLRARANAGDDGLRDRFIALIDPLRYAEGGIDAGQVREIRRIKARVESERLPRGVAPQRHLKLGPGALADVEWTAQLLQLQHAADVPAMRTTHTLRSLQAAHDAGILAREDVELLSDAWLLASRLRAGLALWSGRTSGAALDVLPLDRRDLTGLAQTIGFGGNGNELEEHYLRTARRARSVINRVFYGIEPQ